MNTHPAPSKPASLDIAVELKEVTRSIESKGRLCAAILIAAGFTRHESQAALSMAKSCIDVWFSGRSRESHEGRKDG